MKCYFFKRINFSPETEFRAYLNYAIILNNKHSIFVVKNRVRLTFNRSVPRENGGRGPFRPPLNPLPTLIQFIQRSVDSHAKPCLVVNRLSLFPGSINLLSLYTDSRQLARIEKMHAIDRAGNELRLLRSVYIERDHSSKQKKWLISPHVSRCSRRTIFFLVTRFTLGRCELGCKLGS